MMANEIGFSRVSPDITYNYIYVGDHFIWEGILKIKRTVYGMVIVKSSE
jgi:hypothetical protein